jgi:hypothetical protein
MLETLENISLVVCSCLCLLGFFGFWVLRGIARRAGTAARRAGNALEGDGGSLLGSGAGLLGSVAGLIGFLNLDMIQEILGALGAQGDDPARPQSRRRR